ncbi:MAG: hypothetical protein COA78_03160 [Blastopirellula sp.]|nr:MAG: hypothetical protein COA78_03160 [Blastopirellula sp.]
MLAPAKIGSITDEESSRSGVISKVLARFGTTSRKGVWAIGDQAVVSGTNFCSTIMIGRFCGMNELGLYTLAFGILVLMAVFQQSLILTPFSVFSNRMSEKRRIRYAGSILLQQCLYMSLCVLALIGIGIALYFGLKFSAVGTLFFALALAMPFFSLREFVRRYLLAQLHVRATLIFDMSVAVFQLSGFLYFAYIDQLSSTTAYVVIAMGCGLPSLVFLLSRASSFKLHQKLLMPTIQKHWNFGRWICASQLTDVLQFYSLHWLITIFVGVSATGLYSAYASVLMVFNPFVIAMSGILLPRAAQVHHQGGVSELRRIITKGTVLLILIVFSLSIPIALFGDELIQYLFEISAGSKRGLLLFILLAIVLSGTISVAAESGLCVLERPKVNFLSAISGLVVSLIGSSLLGYWWGIEGVAFGALIGVSVTSIMQITGFVYLSGESQPEGVNAC